MTGYSYNWPDERTRRTDNGLGFLPAVAAAPVIWPGLVSIGSAIGSAIASIFGFGKDDQKTDYRAPANAYQQFVQFNDKYGNEQVAYDMGPQTQQLTAAKGNRWDDVNSYYSAFASNSTSAGASSAARRVIENVARQHGVSISRAADLVLQAAGAVRIVHSLAPSGQGQPTANNQGSYQLPGYCPLGTYHPIGDPFACVPFPDQPPTSDAQNAQRQAAQAAAAAAAAAKQRPSAGAPNLRFNQQTGQWEMEPHPQHGAASGASDFPWWILLVIAGAYVISESGDDRPTYYRRARRR
jgi:hypothetical protein